LSHASWKAIGAAALALAAMLAIAACGGGAQKTGGRFKLDLKIGDLVPMSGVEEPFGGTGRKATDLAVNEIREAIKEVNTDHTVSISHQNYRSEPPLAQELAGRLERGGTTCLVGPWSAQAVIPVATAIAIKRRIIEITPAASNDALAPLEVGGYFHRTIPPARLQGHALATLISSELGDAKDKKVSIGALQNLYSNELIRVFSAAWRNLGGKISAQVIYPPNLPGYKKQARELVAGKPDAFVFFDFMDTYQRVAVDLVKTKKWKATRTFAADSLAVSTLGQTGGATAEGLRGVAPSWPRLGSSAQEFQRLWDEGPPPKHRQPYDTQAFDAVVLCYLSAVAAGSTEGPNMKTWVRRVSSPPGPKFTWQQLPEAIKALEDGQDINYEGASGPIDIEPLDTAQAGDPTAGFYDAYRIKDARLALYASLSVPPASKGIERIPLEYVTPRVPGVGPAPGATGPTGVTGATGADGARQRRSSRNAKPRRARR
jgi:branched-chain amino acid transport system substrate-binding protein